MKLVFMDNLWQCLNRLATLKIKLIKNPILREQYHDVINSYHKDKIIELVNTTVEFGKMF